MRGAQLAVVFAACTDFAACTNFAGLDDRIAADGANSPPASADMTPPMPASEGNIPGSTGGASGQLGMSGIEGNVPFAGSGGVEQPSVVPSQGMRMDAGAPPDEGVQSPPRDAGGEPIRPPEPAAPPGSVRFVSLVAESEVRGADVACISDFNLVGPDGQLLDRALWRAFVDSAEPDYLGGAPAEQAIDADRLSLWHTAWFGLESPPGYPHFLLIDLGAFVQVAGFRYLPRQDQPSGRIAAYRFFASQSSDLGDPVASGVFPNNADEQTVLFAPTDPN